MSWYRMVSVSVYLLMPRLMVSGTIRSTCRKVSSIKGKGKANNKPEPPNACDYTYNYRRAMNWVDLNVLAREADSSAIISHWKLDLVHFVSHGNIQCTLFLQMS